MYIWGGRPGEENRIKALPDVSRAPEDEAEVSLVNIDGGLDVSDVAVGAGHVVVLTQDGRLWAVGRAENGQLACEQQENSGFVEDWRRVEIPGAGVGGRVERVEGVHCGPCCSLVVVRV